MHFPFSRRSAFSLVELSIVLVILGLLTGGILSGQSLIRAAELRSVTSDFTRYSTAIRTFQDKYFGLPGDLATATQFWGSAGGNGADATCYAVASTTTTTCNGNGSGRLLLTDGVTDSSAPEWYRASQHLANAGLIEGSYTGTRDQAPRGATPGKNVPRGRLSQTGFTFMSLDAISSDPAWWAGRYDGFSFGVSTSTVESNGPALKPEEAWNLDTKLDDGKPAYGMVRSIKANGLTCATTVTAATAEYALNEQGKNCGMMMAINAPGN